MKSLIELTEHLREVRKNQPRVTLKEAQEQAKRVMAAKKKFTCRLNVKAAS